MNEFGARLKELRLKEDMSQEELAKKLGVSKSSIAMYETGKRTPFMYTMEAIADAFNVDIDFLYGKTEIRNRNHEKFMNYYVNEDAREYAQFVYDNPKYKVLFDASRNLKEEDIDFVVNMIKHLKNK